MIKTQDDIIITHSLYFEDVLITINTLSFRNYLPF